MSHDNKATDTSTSTHQPKPRVRTVGGTEYSWCRSVPGGTGTTVLALLLSKPPDISLLQNALHDIQISHPILSSKLHFTPSTNTFSFLIPSVPHLQIQLFDLPSTSHILQSNSNSSISPFHLILEHEINRNTWINPGGQSENDDTDVLFASVYTLSEAQWAVMIRLHTSACDRTAAVALLKGLMVEMGGGSKMEFVGNGEVNFGIEELIPNGQCNKPFWARGVDMLGYSLNSFRFSNLEFKDINSSRSTQAVRLQMNPQDTWKLLAGCESRGIKLSAALAAAGLISAHSSKSLPDQWEKYAVVTLLDCRSILDPPLSSQHVGFYHSAILNTHDVNGRETLWELANRCYMSFANSKKSNKHFSDMADLNFLMGKAIDNPGLTPSSSSRTAFISVFEDPVMDNSTKLPLSLGLEDYVGCASVHGVGPSIAVFDTIRGGLLDCACVYPSPLHSREQMQELIDQMKKVLIDGCNNLER